MGEPIAVLDTETTWSNRLMSVGAVIADGETLQPVDKRYYILPAAGLEGGMYSAALYIGGVQPDLECPRSEAMEDLKGILHEYGVEKLFAYNARFDYGLLHELRSFQWFDIMGLAAYRQYNHAISDYADCYATGRLKRGFGVESIYRMLSRDWDYYETHNALFDAMDELAIMQMLGHGLEEYRRAKI